MLEIVAQLNNLRVSPKKVRLVTDSIKGIDVDAAIIHLQFIQKRSAPIILKLLKSAMANAKHNKEINSDLLMVKNILVNQATPLKRWKPAAHGAAHPFKKHGCHIKLILTLKPGAVMPKPKATKAKDKAKKIDTETVKLDKAMKSRTGSKSDQKSSSKDFKPGKMSSQGSEKKAITRTTSK